MRATRLLAIAAALVALGGGLGATLGPWAADRQGAAVLAAAASDTRDDDRQEGYARDLSALRSEIDLLTADLRTMEETVRGAASQGDAVFALRQEIAALRQQVALIAESGADPAGHDEAHDFTPATAEEMDLAEEDEAYDEQQRQRRLGTVFAAQSVDTIWSQDAAYRLTEAFQSEQLVRSSADIIECRSSLCRVEVSHADAAAANEFGLWFPIQVGDALPQIRFFTERRGDGHSVTVMYLAREGYELPAEHG